MLLISDKEIVKRLKAMAGKEAFLGHHGNDELLYDAAKRIDELKKEVLELREKLSDGIN